MQPLHLVGFTTDHRGLIFSVRRGVKSGRDVVALDDSPVEAVGRRRPTTPRPRPSRGR